MQLQAPSQWRYNFLFVTILVIYTLTIIFIANRKSNNDQGRTGTDKLLNGPALKESMQEQKEGVTFHLPLPSEPLATSTKAEKGAKTAKSDWKSKGGKGEKSKATKSDSKSKGKGEKSKGAKAGGESAKAKKSDGKAGKGESAKSKKGDEISDKGVISEKKSAEKSNGEGTKSANESVEATNENIVPKQNATQEQEVEEEYYEYRVEESE
jgi:hypothetical protein